MKKAKRFLIGLALFGTLSMFACSNDQDQSQSQDITDPSISQSETIDFSISESQLSLKVGESKLLTISYTGSLSPSWKSSNTSVALVENGNVTAVGEGNATITVTVQGVSKTCSVSVIDDAKEVNYCVNYYFETLSGEFLLNPGETLSLSGSKGSSVNATIKEFKGFAFDANNELNKTSIVLGEENNVMSVYYLRNEYDITVNGGVASKAKGKYEEIITITPNLGNTIIALISGEEATMSGNDLKVGIGDIVVNCIGESKMYLDPNALLNPNGASASAKMNVKDSNKISGIMFGHMKKDMSHDGIERYYAFGILNKKPVFCVSQDEVLRVIKTGDADVSLGKHTLKFEISSTYSIKCYIDDAEVLNIETSDITSAGYELISGYGRVGFYAQDKSFEFTDLEIISGSISLNEAKTYYKNLGNTFKYSQHEFNGVTCAVEEGIVNINLKDMPSYTDRANKLENDIDKANSLEEISDLLNGSVERKIAAQIEYTSYAMYKMLDGINDVILGLNAEGREAIAKDGSDVSISYDWRVYDGRWYVPFAYKLAFIDPSTGDKGLIGKFEEELASVENLKQIFDLSDKYANDMVRALCFKAVEFYYWNQYAKNNVTNISQWWYLNNYYGAAGDGFAYVGNVYENYAYPHDFRLASVFYGRDAVKTINELIASADWMIKHQTIENATYNVTLNTNGGTLTSTKLNGNSREELLLPVPTRDGYEFDGWYSSRLLGGSTYKEGKIPAGNMNDLTLYAAWKKDGARVDMKFAPADYITENMVIQQNKDIIISGTGEDGAEIKVNLTGFSEEKTIVNGGKWSIRLPGKAGSFDELTLKISSGDLLYSFENIVIGEVWVTTGQSNMDMSTSWLLNRGAQYAGKMIELDNIDKVRIFRQFSDLDKLTPVTDESGEITGYLENEDQYNQNRWIVPTNSLSVLDKSMLSLMFACNIQKELNVPVGVLNSSRGGTYIEEWLSKENVAATYNTIPEEADPSISSRFYDTMTKDIEGVQCAGVIWYQGENNWDHPNEYKAQYKKLVEQYRTLFNDPDLPIIAQQLVQFGIAPYDFSDMRLAQWEVAKEIDNAYCSCSIDSGEQWDIHPADKNIVAARISDIALEYVYRLKEDTLSYEPISCVEENGKIVISFEDGKTIYSTNGTMPHFKVKLSDGTLISVNASIIDNKIVIDSIDGAVEVRYAHETWLGSLTLYGGNDKPVVPFDISIAK